METTQLLRKFYNCVLFIVITIFVVARGDDVYQFPKDFLFGVTTASYQHEGAWNEDGKGLGIWDYYTHNESQKIMDHSTGDIAADSYHKMDDDLKMMEELGISVYRFSISWSRILPNGFANEVNQAGIDYYNRLIDNLLSRNITPFVALYHWDLPLTLMEIGGWTNPILEQYFVDYARVAFQNFGDRVKFWTTFNQPSMICERVEDDRLNTIASTTISPYLCTYTLLKAHAHAYHEYKENFKDQNGQLGIILFSTWYEPATSSTADVEAAQRGLDFGLDMFGYPIYSKEGDYPVAVKERLRNISAMENFPQTKLIELTPDEVDYIRGTGDFLALNHYSTFLITDRPIDPKEKPSTMKDQGINASIDPSWKIGDAPWIAEVPWGFYKLLMYIKEKYDNPVIYIGENGWGDKRMDDQGRIEYIQSYLQKMTEAMDDGCNIKGYMVWSLMDAFEWWSGYSFRFGLYQVDFNDPNRTRTARASVDWYKKLVETGKLNRSSDLPSKYHASNDTLIEVPFQSIF